jgi:hypothetical protein
MFSELFLHEDQVFKTVESFNTSRANHYVPYRKSREDDQFVSTLNDTSKKDDDGIDIERRMQNQRGTIT